MEDKNYEMIYLVCVTEVVCVSFLKIVLRSRKEESYTYRSWRGCV